MRIIVWLIGVLGINCFLQAQPKMALPPAKEAQVAKSLSLRWELLSNFYQGKRQTLSVLVITNTGPEALPAGGWALYFNSVSAPQSGNTSVGLQVQDLSGCLFRMIPSADFKGIAGGDSLRVEYIASDFAANTSDAPEGFYVVWSDAPTKGWPIVHYRKTPITRPELFDRYPGDHIPEATPETVYAINHQADMGTAPDATGLFPTPRSVTLFEDSTGFYKGAPIYLERSLFGKEAEYLSTQVQQLLGLKPDITDRSDTGDGIVLSQATDTLNPEGYRLHIVGGRIHLEASETAGMFYGIQTLLRLMEQGRGQGNVPMSRLPALMIIDQPRFGYRSFLIDVARNFQSQKELFRLIDLMAFCKLNVLHLHLTDDEGWRLEIPSLPELTRVGAKRGHTLDDQEFLRPCYGSGPDTANISGSGFYTRQQFMAILAYARDRHIRVIPEIESPGHARAAIKAMDNRYRHFMQVGQADAALEYLLRDTADRSVYSTPQLYHDDVMNVALPSVYHFIGRVVTEIAGMYKEAGVPLETIHMGGDEVPAGVWEKSPVCLSLMAQHKEMQGAGDLWYYYFTKVDSILHKEGLYTSAWEEAGMRKTMLDGKPYILPNPDFARTGMQVHIWNNGEGAEDLAYRLANAGYKVVLAAATHMYFDMAYNKSFDEFGYYWATFLDVDRPFSYIPFDYLRLMKTDGQGNLLPAGLKGSKERLTDYGKSNIQGLEGCLWGETLRGPADLEYKLLPRLLGLAERAWSPDPAWATLKDSAAAQQAYLAAWSAFAATLGYHILPSLDVYNGGYGYRIPTPGAECIAGKVWANVQFPGMTIRYTVDGKDPNERSPLYRGPLSVKGQVRLRVFNALGRAGRVVEISNP